MNIYQIASIPGDGIGKETVAAGRRVLDAAAEAHGGFALKYREFEWSCEYYLQHGRMMPEDGLQTLRPFDSIFLGAVGFPGVADHISLWGLLLPIRRSFHQYVNLRPVKLLPGVRTPLADRRPEDIDFFVVRENNEGEYSNMGGRLYPGTQEEVVVQNTVFTRHGVERIIRYAFELARRTGRKKVTSATKSNGINFTMPFWDEVFAVVGREYPEISSEQFHIDALCARFVTHPQHFEVVVGSNLFGDILTDLGPAIAGSIGIAPSANLNPEKEYPSMFEPVHGSAPDIAGKGIANPMGQIWCGAMMLEHLGLPDCSELVMQALTETLAAGIATPDIGGRANTREIVEAILRENQGEEIGRWGDREMGDREMGRWGDGPSISLPAHLTISPDFMEQGLHKLRTDAMTIFRAALEAVDPERSVLAHLQRCDDTLLAGAERLELTEGGRVFVVGAGKASGPMAAATENVLGNRIADGAVVTKYGHGRPLEKIRLLEAGHPVPDENGVAAAREIIAILEKAGRTTSSSA